MNNNNKTNELPLEDENIKESIKAYPLDILAIGAHRDDCELMAGGTLIKMIEKGYRVGILDLTQGEMGTRGSKDIRAEEARCSQILMGVLYRENLRIPDTQVEVNLENRLKIIEVLRRLRPNLVIAPWTGHRHPDHNKTSQLVTEACFFSGLRKYNIKVEPHRPKKIIYYLPFRQDIVPNFVVDISEQFNHKMEAIKCYRSQFVDIDEHLHLTPYLDGFLERVKYYNGFLGRAAKVKFAEGFVTKELILIDDITKISAPTF